MAQIKAFQDFTAFYLQRTTSEFAEDLDKVREADDFKADSLPFLIQALQQGTALYSAMEQARVLRPVAAAAATRPAAANTAGEDKKADDVDVDDQRPQVLEADRCKKENQNSKKKKRKQSS